MRKRKLILFFIIIIIIVVTFVFWWPESRLNPYGYCAFCDPQVIETQKFYEDDSVIALYSHKPLFPGHALIIPKRHVFSFEDLSSEEMSHMMDAVKQVHEMVASTFHTSSYLLLQKNGSEVGQTVPHVHMHYIPRKQKDASIWTFLFRMYWTQIQKPLAPERMQQVVQRLKNHEARCDCKVSSQ